MMSRSFVNCAASAAIAALLLLAPCAGAQSDQVIYSDALQNGWMNWGWTEIDYSCTNPVHSGADSISVTITNNSYQAIYLAHSVFDSTPYTNLTFWINGGAAGGQQLQVVAELSGQAQAGVPIAPLPTNAWEQITVSLASLGVADQPDLSGFWVQDRIGSAQPTFYLDDISLIAAPASTNIVTNPPVSITVDAQMNQRPISPLIYGVAFAVSNQMSDLNSPIDRSGGNAETRYNWQLNAHNLASDWYFESYPDSSSVPGATDDAFIATNKANGAASMITIPMIGWAPILGPNRSIIPSYSVAKYGPQTGADPFLANAGNGISVTNDTPITWNDPNDANTPVGVSFQQSFVSHLTNTWGLSTQGGVGYYLLDNEHSIWFSTHRDVHPIGPTMQEILGKMIAYGTMIKSLDSSALVLGPEEWGWSGYFYSGYDQQWSGQHNDYNPADYPDRATNGGMDYIPFLLSQIRQHDATNGYRTLDYLTVHCYPQGGEDGTNASAATELARNASTRQLWDSNYVDPTWINAVIDLIPRMHAWVSNYYPGTKIGITEYNWGADGAMNGATAQADILGIFGREGLDLATRWTAPNTGTPAYLAFKIYRNYDGAKSTFGDTSVSATGPNPDNVSAFAATRSTDGALTVMVVNKQLSGITPSTVTITNFVAEPTAQQWQLASNAITRLPDINLAGMTISNLLPPQSVTLYIIGSGAPPDPPTLEVVESGGGMFHILLSGQSGHSYALESSANLQSWQSIQTNAFSGTNAALVSVPISGVTQFYRAVLVQ